MTSRKRNVITTVLAILVVLQLLGVLYYFNYFISYAYLPAPFIYDKSDTFMDFFHVLYWSTDPGRYSVWGSVYPPLNFLIMKLIGFTFLDSSRFSDGFELRSQSFVLRIFIVTMAISMVAISMRSHLWESYSLVQKHLLFLFCALSAPVLFAIERGNIIVLCLPILAGVMASSGVRRLILIAVLINLKPYFALLALAPLVAGRWHDLFFIGLCAATIFIISGLLLDPAFLYFFPNILSFGQSASIFSGREVLALPSSIDAFAYSLIAALSSQKDLGLTLGLTGVDWGHVSFAIGLLNKAALVLALLALFSARNRLPQTQLFAFLVVIICNMGVWVGGYSFAFFPYIIPALFYFRLRWALLASVVLILLPLDAVVVFRELLPERPVFSSGIVQQIEFQITLGTLLRPTVDFVILVLMSVDILLRRWSLVATDVEIEQRASK